MTEETTTTPAPTTPTPKVCFCGCGGHTKNKFVPGHDARFHGLVKRAVRGEVNIDDALASLPHDEAREAFAAYADKIADSEAARKQRKIAEAAAKAQERADRAKAKADAAQALVAA